MNNLIWSKISWSQYKNWQIEDRRIVKRINDLIESIMREGLMKGIGKPEPLKYIKAYSRRIDDENRLVYINDVNNNLVIISCKGHYHES